MSDTVNNSYVIQFSAKVHAESQQIKSRLRSSVEIQPMNAEKMAYDGLGTIEAQELSGRYVPVNFADIEHKRRKITARKFAVTLPIDASDVEKSLLDPKSHYSDACIRAMERKFDRVVVEAMFATVYTGQEFGTAVTAANDGVLTVDATAGLTYDKFLAVIQNFMNAEVGTDMPETFIFGFTGDEHTALMNESKLISGDYTHNFVVNKGHIDEVMGNKVVYFGAKAPMPILQLNASSKRRCFCMSTRAICVGMTREFKVKVQPRNDYYDTEQVQITGVWGAVRTEGKLIQEITTTPAA